ncbi:hypothetical protein EDB89DRAFT_694126 [Lactarius sanguifluus]|nr:hypothetical protein EDB89DRAFT_694126 [Lactarius sanguifluus]
MSRSSISINVLEHDEESLSGTGSHGRLFNDQLDWPGTSDPAPISQCPPSATQGDGTFMRFPGDYARYPYRHLPPNDLSGVLQFLYTDVATNATTGFPDVGDSYSNPPGGYQDRTECVGLPVSDPLRFGPTFDGRDPSLTEGPAFLPVPRRLENTLFPSASDLQPPPLHQGIGLDHLYFSQTLPQTPSAETDVTRNISRMVVPLSDDHPFVPTRPFPSSGSYPGESGDHEALTATMGIRGSTWDGGMAPTPLGTTTTFSPSSSQALGLHSQTYSAVWPPTHLPDSTLNDYSPLDPYSSHDEAAPSLGHQVRQLSNTVASTPPSSRVTARRGSKKYRVRCIIPGCSSTFAQRQGLNRHIKDRHSHWRRCPYCNDFKWPEGRSYLLTKHLKKCIRLKSQQQTRALG